MDTMKRKNFERNHPEQSFPWFRSLDPIEAEALRVRICMKKGLSCDTDGLTLARAIFASSQLVDEVYPCTERFDLSDVVEQLGISPAQHVYINWYRYDQLDCMKFDDLGRYFDDLWYPSEDIEVFDDTLSWIVLIMHYDQLRLAHLTL